MNYMGIDVGHSESKPTTGLCLITLDQTKLQWQCCNTVTQDDKRLVDIRRLVPAGTALAAVGIDGPLASDLQIVNCYRATEALLSRGSFQSRCKPGPTNSNNGQALHQHATELANLVLRLQSSKHLNLGIASHPDRIHPSRIVEVFPNAFLGVLLSDDDFQNIKKPIKRGKKSDVFWEIAVKNGYLLKLIEHLAPGTLLARPLDSITDHDHRAAFICALAALCVAENKYVGVGDPQYGDIFLPPCQVWGLDGTFQSRWAETTLKRNVVSVRRNLGLRPNHGKARVVRNGNLWL